MVAKGAVDLSYFTGLFLLLLTGFAVCAHFVFGANVKGYEDLASAIASCMDLGC